MVVLLSSFRAKARGQLPMDIGTNESLPFYFATWGKLLQFCIYGNQHTKESKQKKLHILNCNIFSVDKEAKRLSWSKKTEAILQNPLKIASSNQIKVCVIVCAEVSIDPYNLCRPVVVTAFNCVSETVFILHIYFPESDSFTQLCSFCWKETLCLDDIYVKLLDGPSIVLHFQKYVFIGFWDPQSKVFVTKQYSVTFTSPHSIKHSWKGNNRQLLLLAVSSVNSQETSVHDDSMADLFEDSSTEPTGSDWLLLRASIDEMEAVDDYFSLPRDYADVTVKMLVLESNRNGSSTGGVILATRLAQLVVMEADNHSQLCDLPFGDVISLSVVTVGDNEEVILVGSEKKGVCLVDLKTFKVQKHWLSSISVFCEDFLHLGWNQLLLISEHLSVDKAKQNSFILTDLIHTWSSAEADCSEATDDGKGDACDKYLLNALHAVEIKLQNTSTLLQNLQLQSIRKNSVIEQSRTALQAISEQTGILPQREPSLMSIISPDDQEELPKNLALEQTYCILVKTNSFWQRIVGGKWIIGIKVENNGTRPVSDICLLLVYTNHPDRDQTSTSHVLYPSEVLSRKTDVRTEGSLSLGPGQEMWVTSVLQCPLFDDTPTIMYDIALIWKEWILSDHKVQQSVEKRKCVHKSSLSFKDLDALTINVTLDGIFAGKVTKVDFLALDAIQECNRLIVSSQHTAFQGVSHLLYLEMGFAQVKMNEVDGLFCDKGQLAGMRIFNESVSATSLKMDVYSWDKNQLIIFCRTLYNILPYDASVQADVDSGSSARIEASSHLILHLQSELDMIKEAMTSDSQQEASKPALSVSKGLSWLKDFVNLRENTDEAMRKFSSISGT